MRKSNHELIRKALNDKPDGLTVPEIAQSTGVKNSAVCGSLNTMPDAYIDRWVRRGEKGKSYRPVWCCVTVPSNCPHPEKES
jgi:DNA-binding IclR family transcriptional regulator